MNTHWRSVLPSGSQWWCFPKSWGNGFPTAISGWHLPTPPEQTMHWTLVKFQTFRKLPQIRQRIGRDDLGTPCHKKRALWERLRGPPAVSQLSLFSSHDFFTVRALPHLLFPIFSPFPGRPSDCFFYTCCKFWRLRLKGGGFRVCSLVERNGIQAQRKDELWFCGWERP